MQRILVTGGLGFIGSNFTRHVLKTFGDSVHITNLDSISYGANPQNLNDQTQSPRYRFAKGDVTDPTMVERLVSGVELIVHFAAETHVDRSISNPEAFVRSNVVGTFTLLEAARKSNVKKFIHISTDEVYGSAPANKSYTENDRPQPSSPYSASKAASDMLVESYNKTYGLNTAILRSTNNFGPYQFPEKFIPKTIICALLSRGISIYGTGKQMRDWIYVLDFCKAIKLVMEKSHPGTMYNVSSGNEIQNVDVAKLILKALKKPESLLSFVEDRPGHDFRYSLNSNRIRDDLGWKPEHSFESAVQETVGWYVENESWWRPLITDKVLSPTPWKQQW
jgi:dTDP-glucose 4,6-dehydratase